MADEPRTAEEFSEEELEAQEAEELPERESMMIVDPGPELGFGGSIPWSNGHVPDDRYEQ